MDLLDLWVKDPWDIPSFLFLSQSGVVDTLGAGGLPGDIGAQHGGDLPGFGCMVNVGFDNEDVKATGWSHCLAPYAQNWSSCPCSC